MRIPTLAIHLDRSVKDGFKFNAELQLNPIIGLPEADANVDVLKSTLDLKQAVASELCLYDVQPPCLGGSKNEFVFSARLDNLCSTFCALQGLLAASSDSNAINMLAMFDNEEVGSVSPPGANSTLVEATLRRALQSLAALDEGAFYALTARSLLISADMAHAVHPNYSDMHDELHRPLIGNGLVVKYNSNARYASTLRTTSRVKAVFKQCNVSFQELICRNDGQCGSTIGPMLAARLGMECVDIGVPQLSMHRIREMCGTTDVLRAVDFFRCFYSAPSVSLHVANA